MADKVYKSYRQMLTILRDRGMDIPKVSVGSRVMRILERENYYNVINGYKDLFLQSPATGTTPEKYLPGTTFDEVYALYCFDRELRSIFLRYLLKIENAFKTALSHSFSQKYGHDNYLRLENFNAASEENISNVISLIGDIQKEISRQMTKHNSVVTHYMTEYGYIPLWVLVNILTVGKITNFYKLMKPADKIDIARSFKIDAIELHKYMTFLGQARNKCAHDERLFDIKNRAHIKSNLIRDFSCLNIPRTATGNYANGTNDLYSIAIIFAVMLSKSELQEFVGLVNVAMTKLDKCLHTITLQHVLTHMGFHNDWRNILLLSKRLHP